MSEGKKLDRMIRKPELLNRLGVTDPTVWRWEQEGKFPKRIGMGNNSVAWLESEVEAWIAEKAAARE